MTLSDLGPGLTFEVGSQLLIGGLLVGLIVGLVAAFTTVRR